MNLLCLHKNESDKNDKDESQLIKIIMCLMEENPPGKTEEKKKKISEGGESAQNKNEKKTDKTENEYNKTDYFERPHRSPFNLRFYQIQFFVFLGGVFSPS